MIVLCAALLVPVKLYSEKAYAEEPCASIPPTPLTVEWSHVEPKYTQEKTFAEMKSLARTCRVNHLAYRLYTQFAAFAHVSKWHRADHLAIAVTATGMWEYNRPQTERS